VLICAIGLYAATADARAADAAADPIAAAIASSGRPADDRGQDGVRQPGTFLAFLGVKPGWHVIDVFSAGGYYTELLSRIVGPSGEVIAYNNPPYAAFAAKEVEKRYAANRLSNVRQITKEVDELALAPKSLDAALFVIAYHDMYWRPADGTWNRTDPKVMLSKLHAALKDDGVVLVEDHVAKPNDDTSGTVDKLHRIDPALVRRDFEAAGFALDAQSAAFAREDDDHTKLVFDPSIRGKTDKFLYRFRKSKR
jgi:predicted methyltransferase